MIIRIIDIVFYLYMAVLVYAICLAISVIYRICKNPKIFDSHKIKDLLDDKQQPEDFRRTVNNPQIISALNEIGGSFERFEL